MRRFTPNLGASAALPSGAHWGWGPCTLLSRPTCSSRRWHARHAQRLPTKSGQKPVSYTHLRAHETSAHL
eukprot:6113858-Alexandrium_andersonii.AAC.1